MAHLKKATSIKYYIFFNIPCKKLVKIFCKSQISAAITESSAQEMPDAFFQWEWIIVQQRFIANRATRSSSLFLRAYHFNQIPKSIQHFITTEILKGNQCRSFAHVCTDEGWLRKWWMWNYVSHYKGIMMAQDIGNTYLCR